MPIRPYYDLGGFTPTQASQPSSPPISVANQPLPAIQRLLLANSGGGGREGGMQPSGTQPGFDPASFENPLPTGGAPYGEPRVDVPTSGGIAPFYPPAGGQSQTPRYPDLSNLPPVDVAGQYPDLSGLPPVNVYPPGMDETPYPDLSGMPPVTAGESERHRYFYSRQPSMNPAFGGISGSGFGIGGYQGGIGGRGSVGFGFTSTGFPSFSSGSFAGVGRASAGPLQP
jgi:hypothetical protein